MENFPGLVWLRSSRLQLRCLFRLLHLGSATVLGLSTTLCHGVRPPKFLGHINHLKSQLIKSKCLNHHPNRHRFSHLKSLPKYTDPQCCQPLADLQQSMCTSRHSCTPAMSRHGISPSRAPLDLGACC